MLNDSQLSQIKDLVSTSQSILVLITPDASLDILAASSSLFLGLEQAGKEVVYASPDLPSHVDPNLVGTDLIKTEISNKNLIVSFDYAETAVEKVSYHIGEETNRFYLTVQPQKGQSPLNKETVEVEYVGAEADLIFLIGIHDYDSLDHLYLSNENLFKDTPVIAINNYDAEIGSINLNTAQDVNISCAMAQLIRKIELPMDGNIATNLLLSIEKTTDGLRSLSITPDLLETAAWLMRLGARRIRTNVSTEKTVISNNLKKTKVKPKGRPVAAKSPKKKGGLDHEPGVMSKSN